jgi:uncharacterized protein (DUF169 family)
MTTFEQAPGLHKKPIAIGFFDDEPPAGVEQWSGGAVPAGCAFWREAWEGRTFYTVTADHLNCAVGAYTHRIPQPAERETALNDTVSFMVSNGYLQMSEVPMIPVLPKTPRFIAYGPAEGGHFRADVVVVVANPASMMLIYEAALRSGVGNISTPALGRPACAVLPMAINSGATAMSFGCKGNRTFTGLPETELYLAIPGAKWDAVADALRAITGANATMEAHYQRHESAVRGLPTR